MAVNQLRLGTTTGNSLPVDALNLPAYVDSVVLVADTDQDYTVPTGGKFIFMNAADNFYVKLGTGNATIPSASTSDGSASELNPAVRLVRGGDVISFISSTTNTIQISVYS